MDLKGLAPLLPLIARVERGDQRKDIARDFGISPWVMSNLIHGLRAAGVNVQRGSRKKFEKLPVAEVDEFRAWKAAQSQRMAAE